VLGDVDGLQDGLAEIGEGGGGFGLDLALGYGGEETAQGGTEIARGEIASGKIGGNIAADFVGGESLRFLACMEVAEMRMV